MKRPLILSTLIGTALGFALGAWWRDFAGPRTDSALPPAARSSLAAPGARAPRPLTPDIDALQKELAACQLAARMDQVQREGLPQPFPADWAQEYRSQAAIQANAERAIADCGLPLEVARVDCAEPPCLLWLERHDNSDLVKGFLRGCTAWTDQYTDEGWYAQGQLVSEEGSSRRYWAITASPADWPPQEEETNISKRLGLRYHEGRDALMDAWGGIEPTERETLEDLRRQLQDPDMDAGTREVVESLADMIEEKIEGSPD